MLLSSFKETTGNLKKKIGERKRKKTMYDYKRGNNLFYHTLSRKLKVEDTCMVGKLNETNSQIKSNRKKRRSMNGSFPCFTNGRTSTYTKANQNH